MTRWNEMTNTECSGGWVPVGRSMNVCICVFISRVCVVVLYVPPPRFSPPLHSHLPVGECGVPHALPCVPTPWPTLFDMANVNRCCTVTGSGRLLRGWWKRSCSSPWQRTVKRSQYSRKQQRIRVCVGDVGDRRGWTISNLIFRIIQLTTPCSVLWL